MDKRLSRTDYMLSLLLIVMLVAIVGAFFYGIKIGQDKTAHKFAQMNEEQAEPKEPSAYDQQVLVSFYHTIYLPFRQFQNKWFEQMNAIETRAQPADTKSLLKELGRIADESYDKMETTSIPASSPLLQGAGNDYMKSLKLFSEALRRFQGESTALGSGKIIEAIGKDAYFQEAQSFALSAQERYYDSIVQWNLTVDPRLGNMELLDKDDLALSKWSLLNFNQKNEFIAKLLKDHHYFKHFYPQDITLRTDDLIRNGQADKLGLNMIKRTMETLMDTDAVREGDFIKGKNKYYGDETIPQLPFFYQ